MLVEALLVKRGLRAELQRRCVGRLGVRVTLGGEEHLAAPELDLVAVRCRGIALHDFVERGERLAGLSGGLVGARELVEHLVVARVVRVGLEQRRIERDRLGARKIDRRHLVLHALELAGFEIEVPEATQRFGAQQRIRVLQLEEAAVILHRPRRARGHWRGLLYLDRTRAQVLDGGRCIFRLRLVGRLRDRRESRDERQRTARDQVRDRSHGASPPGGGAAGPGAARPGAALSAAGGGLAARS